MSNTYTRLASVVPAAPLQIGTAAASADGLTTVTLPGGSTLHVRGDATPGATVYIRAGVIESTGPALPIDVIEI